MRQTGRIRQGEIPPGGAEESRRNFGVSKKRPVMPLFSAGESIRLVALARIEVVHPQPVTLAGTA